jgi:phosphotransferase system enzyme I (PtsI)
LDSDIEPAFAADAEGIGLFRSEFLYMNRTLEPDEEEQFKTYKKAAEVFKGKPVIIRTLDIGGDKEIPYLGLDKEENPFLGWRAVRYCLDKEQIFRTQLRALLRASAFGNIRIMIPMISAVKELVKCREIIESIKVELKAKGIAFNGAVHVGIMIETPAAAMIADKLAHYADFFSIGTNDLTQYTIAVDRGNERVSSLYSAYHPAVLRLIYQVIKAANEHGIMSGVCGEAGSDPLIAKFLIGCGVKEISMSPSRILRIRKLVMEKSSAELHNKVENGLFTVSDVEDAQAFLESL